MINEDFSLIAYCYKGFFDTASAHAQGLYFRSVEGDTYLIFFIDKIIVICFLLLAINLIPSDFAILIPLSC